MSRILVDLPEPQLQELSELAVAERRPRAVLVREAIAAYLDGRRQTREADVFGLWKHKKLDGLEYQQEVRSEW